MIVVQLTCIWASVARLGQILRIGKNLIVRWKKILKISPKENWGNLRVSEVRWVQKKCMNSHCQNSCKK